MLESLTIFTKGGLILYQYTANPSLVGADDGVVHTRLSVNEALIAKILLDPAVNVSKTYHISGGLTYAWINDRDNDRFLVALYPDILFEGPRHYLKAWAEDLLQSTYREYNLYFEAKTATAKASQENIHGAVQDRILLLRPDPSGFDPTFQILLQKSKTQKPIGNVVSSAAADASSSSSSTSRDESGATTNNKTGTNNKMLAGAAATATAAGTAVGTGGKEKRHWGDAKVTDRAMAALDMSKDSATATSEETETQKLERALQEARQAFLPNAEELRLEQEREKQQQQQKTAAATSSSDESSSSSAMMSSWSSNVTSLLQQLTGNKVLTTQDLDAPLQKMELLLTSKNVAQDIAHNLCESCRSKLIGKRLNSLYRVQTAVQQALEGAVRRILHNEVDLIRNVARKRGDGTGVGGLFGSSSTTAKKRPYVISVMGINGIGKTTSLAKLAFFFQQHGCKPLLVAGDTFRSGAVEQLKVHAACLDVPIYSAGYSKDPSAVAKAAIQQATDSGNDVVLIDTAGRMQNNVPLMKALGKLVQENKPDYVVLVCEALVGHDGLNQHQMFAQAVGARGIDGLILTKFDTVGDQVGAALTLTYQTGSPIVFCGTGQKYHHLKKLSVESIVQSLLS